MVEIGLDVLTQLPEMLTIDMQFAREAGGTFALGNPTQEQHDCGRVLAGLLKHTASEDGVRTLALAAAIGREVLMATEQPAVSALAARAHQATRMEMLLKP